MTGPGEEEIARGPVLACFAHADDMEIAAGGTLARWAGQGREVRLLLLTNGDRGSQDPARDRAELARTRIVEQEAAARVLGLAGFRVLDVSDGELENVHEVRLEVAREIRRVRPTTVVTCDPTATFLGNRYFNHSDHRTAGIATLDALFPGAGNPHFFRELLDEEGLEPWSVPRVHLAWTTEPNSREDVTGFFQAKLDALAEHKSQLEGGMLGFFERWLRTEAEENGRAMGVEHAEAFRVLELD
ncbi:MAG: PIG-L family deacetylase [Actinobacteria bacterium]|nr:PIG-L family deacetylase [Actinomycetota bacterium]